MLPKGNRCEWRSFCPPRISVRCLISDERECERKCCPLRCPVTLSQGVCQRYTEYPSGWRGSLLSAIVNNRCATLPPVGHEDLCTGTAKTIFSASILLRILLATFGLSILFLAVSYSAGEHRKKIRRKNQKLSRSIVFVLLSASE